MVSFVADMDPVGMETFLSQFGIKRHRNAQGKINWTINVITQEADAQTQSAYLDERLGFWKLHQSPGYEPLDAGAAKEEAEAHRENTSPPAETKWTHSFPSSSHAQALLDWDWGATSLGPLETWPRSLQLYTQMLLSDFRPATIYWGPRRIAIYNEALIPVIGAFHPALMGRSFEEVLPHSWEYFGPLFRALEEDGHGVARHGLEHSTMRNGYLEESWWDGGLIALRDDCGGYGGAYFSWTEATRTTLRDRRTRMINQLGHSSLSPNFSFWQHVHDILGNYPRDIPMAMMYSSDEGQPSNGRLHRRHTIGIDEAHVTAPSELDLASTDEDTVLMSLLRRAQEISADFLVVDLSIEKLYATLLENINWVGFGEPSRHLAVVPIRDKFLTKGFIILGLNPRRTFDEDHKQFVTELARQLNETAIRATFRQDLQNREQVLATELSESEKRASRMAQIVPVGIYELAADGALHWANRQFFEIMGVPHGQRQKESFVWTDYIHPEDHERANEKMANCLLQGLDISDTLRLRRSWQPPGLEPDSSDTSEPFWVMYSASLNLKADGSTSSLTGSMTDISHLKWAEQLQLRNAETARRERRVQEEFIDITSHEMRNPLSAITQSADGILLSLEDAKEVEDPVSLQRIIGLNAEAAESILFCAAHQKRIIDDILTLGKLDSKLLTISPAAFSLQDLLDQALQMFKAEFEVNKIQVKTVIEMVPVDARPTESTNSIFYGDSSRLLQVLVNLMTNAIKFTKHQPLRHISVRCGWSSSSPPPHLFGKSFQWHCTDLPRPDLTQDPDYGQGEPSYLHFAITDSGEGISPDALERIFTKFEQADRRTHTKYGGSGLGLYISRELSELQGGCIGIESALGIGSTFAFYTKVRQPDAQTPLNAPNFHTIPGPEVALGKLDLRGETLPRNLQPQTNYNILVVEDNVLNQNVLAKQLRRAGCSVQVGNHGGEAVDIVLRRLGQATQYNTVLLDDQLPYLDCILMDWEMPICDGIKATKTIRSIEKEQGAERSLIIGITANVRSEQIERARDAGMDEVVPKPFRVAELLAKIRGFAAPS
ncbi:hypothetical protein C7974DRAFT_385149 [Boeremia exigua]|uniref:uncharacterized protein n=1 Tax=Boeremia exigua TaxID=749465 RepID=UPI001E8DE5A2|nr:uncharacterized protein C7974DRAFT_385149 [Boeremia exigua]KAH6642270.1 hypothetical protein C7974DRAFT_385149 [Boeremia exigua]